MTSAGRSGLKYARSMARIWNDVSNIALLSTVLMPSSMITGRPSAVMPGYHLPSMPVLTIFLSM